MNLRAPVLVFLLCLALASCEGRDHAAKPERAAPGVTDAEILLGSSLALEGHAGYLGAQTLRGALSYLNHVNENEGGVFGRKIRVRAYDDAYDPPRCLANTQRLIVDDQVFALFCYVGTPTAVKILPMVDEARIPLLGLFTGAKALREPFNRLVVNVRCSYYQETATAVRHLVQDLGLRRIAVFYQYDAFGFDGLTGAELALKDFGLEPVARGFYVRGTSDVEDGFARIERSGAEAVVMIGTSEPCARFIRLSEEGGYAPVFYTVSFVGAEELARRLGPAEKGLVIMSQVVPPPDRPGGASDYRAHLKRSFPGDTPNYVGLEGYINAQVLVEGLRRAGRELTRERFLEAIESIHAFKPGPDIDIGFSATDHQGMDRVYMTRLENERFVPISDWLGIRQSMARAGSAAGSAP